jgi:hypothetical protein
VLIRATSREFDLNSAVCSAKISIKDGKRVLQAEGYAFGSRGTPIKRVEVSYDGERKEWHEAELEHQAEKDSEKDWGWTLWRFEAAAEFEEKLVVTARAGKLCVVISQDNVTDEVVLQWMRKEIHNRKEQNTTCEELQSADGVVLRCIKNDFG